MKLGKVVSQSQARFGKVSHKFHLDNNIKGDILLLATKTRNFFFYPPIMRGNNIFMRQAHRYGDLTKKFQVFYSRCLFVKHVRWFRGHYLHSVNIFICYAQTRVNTTKRAFLVLVWLFQNLEIFFQVIVLKNILTVLLLVPDRVKFKLQLKNVRLLLTPTLLFTKLPKQNLSILHTSL